MPRGGAREGKPGASYANRTDLQAVKVAPGQQYGKGVEQRRAQQALPLAGATNPGPGAPAARPSAPPPPAGPTPGMLTPLDAPTQRPNEPLTAGMAMGPGAGVEANPFAQVGSSEDAKLAIMAALRAYPSTELLELMQRLELG